MNESQKTAYLMEHLVTHLARSGGYSRLFDLLEKKDFLARQADVLGGFRQGSRDLERHVLEAAIELRDWPRFLRHAVVAIGLRGLAEALADDEIIAALARRGEAGLADDIVEQLTNRQARIRARAVVLGVRGAGDIGRLIEEIDAVPDPDDLAAARSWLDTLQTVARHLGPELRRHWSGWIERLRDIAPELTDDAWLAVAESWLEHDLGEDSGLWSALTEVTAARLPQFLPRRLAASPRRAATYLDHALPLPETFENRVELHSLVRVGLLAARATEEPWPYLRRSSIDSIACVELGRELWPRLEPDQRDRLAAEIDDPTVRAAFRIVTLEGLRATADREVSQGDETAALDALEGLPLEARLHWTLRCLAALAPSCQQRRVRTIALDLYALRYDVSSDEDLARFADLIARVLPADLPRVLPNVLAAPSSNAERLRTLAGCCQQELVLDELRKNVERYAMAAGEDDGEAFQLRVEILSRIAGRLCALRGDLKPYREALERLLPEEEEPLRLAVIDELAAGGETCGQLALEVWGDLRSRRAALRSRLRLSAGDEQLDDVLSPSALYRAVSGSGAVADELAALDPLLSLPASAGGRRGSEGRGARFLDVHDSDRRILAVLDLARHDLTFQRLRLRPGQFDPVAALRPLARVVGGVSTDLRLASLIPELVEMGSQVEPNRALAELQEAVLRLLRLEEVAWPVRAEALETILSHVEPWVLGADGTHNGAALAGRRRDARRRAAVAFFRWIVRLAEQPDLPGELAHRWPELLPIVLAAAERLPVPCRRRLWHPWPAPIEQLMSRLWGHRRSPWARGAEGFTAWAAGASRAAAREAPDVLAACFASPEGLAAQLVEMLESFASSPIVRALLCQLAVRDAERIPVLLERLAPSRRRALALRLVRHGWLRELPPRSLWRDEKNEEQVVRRLRLARALRRGVEERAAEAVAEGIAEALTRDRLDPLDARSAPARRALWAVGEGSCCATLARAVIDALSAGRGPAERALCFWVHSWVKPRLGVEASASRERLSALKTALAQAGDIPTLSSRDFLAGKLSAAHERHGQEIR